MNQYKLVLPEHLNHYGYLFGGNMLKWADEYSWIAASLDHPGCKFVTIGMDRVEFRKGVDKGAILRFDVQQAHRGATSVRYTINVYADSLDTGEEELVFTTQVSFVCLDAEGNKRALPE
jgi:acyl-CoA hydrolase